MQRIDPISIQAFLICIWILYYRRARWGRSQSYSRIRGNIDRPPLPNLKINASNYYGTQIYHIPSMSCPVTHGGYLSPVNAWPSGRDHIDACWQHPEEPSPMNQSESASLCGMFDTSICNSENTESKYRTQRLCQHKWTWDESQASTNVYTLAIQD